MAMSNPGHGGRTTSPNSVARRPRAAPREDPRRGYRSYPEEMGGAPSGGLRPESFADHYSQARQFYISQTDIERRHIAEAFHCSS